MSFLSDLLPIAGTVAGAVFGGPAGAAIGGSLGAGLSGALNSNQAANAQNQGAQNAINTQMQMYQQNQQQLAPWMQSGQAGNAALQSYLGLGPGGTFNPNAPGVAPFNASMLPGDPSYQWRLQQGNNALLNNASAMGGLGSGNTMKSLDQYSQNLASTQYQTALQNYMQQQNNAYNKLAGVANTGVNAAGNLAGLGANAAGSVGGLQNQQGSTTAAGILGGGNALLGGANNASLNWLLGSLGQQQQSAAAQAPYAAYTYDPNTTYPPAGYGPQ